MSVSVIDGDGQYVRVHTEFTERDMAAVVAALDRRLGKIQAGADADAEAKRRKALEGLK